MPEDNGLSNQELLLEIRADLKAHLAVYQRDRVHLTTELQQRPTRREVIGLFSGMLALAGVLSGVIFGILSVTL